jgi:hypothetical protein
MIDTTRSQVSLFMNKFRSWEPSKTMAKSRVDNSLSVVLYAQISTVSGDLLEVMVLLCD